MKSFKLQREENDLSGEKSGNTIRTVTGIIILVGVVWFFWGGGIEIQTTKNLDDIYRQVSSDAVQQYEIVKRNGTAIDVCVQAGLVSASYLQAKDEVNYQRWKTIENSDCASAGLPRQ